MSHFIDSSSIKVLVLSDGSNVTIQSGLTFNEFEEIFKQLQSLDKDDKQKTAIILSKRMIRAWDLKDDKGNVVPYSTELVDKLNVKFLLEISQMIQDEIFPEKKSSKTLEPTLPEEKKTETAEMKS